MGVDRSLESALQSLEWPRFIALAQTQARTEPAKERLASLTDPAEWAGGVDSAQALHAETQEMLPLLDRDALWGPLLERTDPEAMLESLDRGAVLELEDFVILRLWLYAIDSWAQTPRDEIRGEQFKQALARLMDPFEPLRNLDRLLTPDNELSEKASPRLAALNAEIRSLKKEISAVLDQLLKTYSHKGILQESFSDVRDGRFVIPIKISCQNEVDGIIYEASASRQTVFVEPKEVGPLNNRLRQRQNDLVQEIYEILREASKKMQPFTDEIRGSVEILVHWDVAQARARLGRLYGGKPIRVTDERRFELHHSAHPLLWWSLEPTQIIRNQIEFGDPVRTLLLTGPNTGGKTVLLKTLGLAGLCARTGFPFPGTDQPTVPFFDRLFSDLGDPQSIEQHLSSFSGHILRFKDILTQMSERSLVLLDELNTATDPEEGAALGRAFLETVMGRGAMIVATTHDPRLKALAVTDQRIMNASMAFDENARMPTYRMVIGVPGRSRALETAARLGIPEAVLSAARQYLTREHQDFERTISQLQDELASNTQLRKEAQALRDEAERLRREWLERTELSVGQLLDKTRQKLRRILEQAQDDVRASVQKLDEARSRREIDQTRGKLTEAFNEATARLDKALDEEAPALSEALGAAKAERKAQEAPPAPIEAPAIKQGNIVRIPKWKNTGTVLEIKGGKAKVAMGALQMTLSLSDIEPLSKSEKALHEQIQASTQRAKQNQKAALKDVDLPPVPSESLDLRGKRYDEAMAEAERYLDQAYRSGGRKEVTIVHGLGTGALREGVRELLSHLPYVKEYRDGGVGHGGTGATLVEFDV